jgi:putative ABC transport system permease protein
MKLKYILKLSVDGFMQRKLRSSLTIVGIVIGVAAVVAIMSMAAGMQQAVTEQLSGLGADIITISAGGGRASRMFVGPGGGGALRDITGGGSSGSANLTIRDMQVIKSVTGIKFVNGIVSGRVEVSYLGESTQASVQGVDPLAWKEMATTNLDSGRYLSSGDANSVIIGYSLANSVFKKAVPLNTLISIEGRSYRVVGVLESSGGFTGSDNNIIVTTASARTVIDNVEADQFSSIQVQVEDSSTIEDVMASIEKKLLLSRHVTEDKMDFTVSSSQAMLDTVSSMLDTVSLFLAGIAAISLLVGAIGIANTMFMSIMERTRQIGILKALGTTNFEVMKLFLAESAIIGLMGGIFGVLTGFVASLLISNIAGQVLGGGGGAMSSFSAIITPELVLFALGFSMLIGLISGIIPARRASKLQPTAALRYE